MPVDLETQVKTRPIPRRLLADLHAASPIVHPVTAEDGGQLERSIDDMKRPLVLVGQGDSASVIDGGLAFESDDHSDAVMLYVLAALLLAVGFVAGFSFHHIVA